MSEYDRETGKLRPTWAVSFSPWVVMLGSVIGGVVTGGVLAALLATSGGSEELGGTDELAKTAIGMLGATVLAFMVLGPALGWGVGFVMRNVKNQNFHVIAFGGLGLVAGLLVGDAAGTFLDVEGLGQGVAPIAGIGAALGRWSISRFANV